MTSLAGQVVVITGARGFIGNHLLRRLRNENLARLVVVSRQGHVSEEMECVGTDLTSITPDHWRKSGLDSIDVVFHLASRTPKSRNDVTPSQAYRDNLAATRKLLASLPPTKRFIYTSTIDVYGSTGGIVLDESAPLAPANLYAASKVFAEEMVYEWANEQAKACSILRYGHIYGPGEEAYSKLIPQTIRALKRGESPVLHGEGRALRDYLYVTDAVEATVRAAGVADRAIMAPVNVVSGQSVSIREVVERLCSFTDGIKPRYKSELPNGHSLRFDCRRMRETLGEWPLVGLAEGLRCEWESFCG